MDAYGSEEGFTSSDSSNDSDGTGRGIEAPSTAVKRSSAASSGASSPRKSQSKGKRLLQSRGAAEYYFWLSEKMWIKPGPRTIPTIVDTSAAARRIKTNVSSPMSSSSAHRNRHPSADNATYNKQHQDNIDKMVAELVRKKMGPATGADIGKNSM